MKLCTALLLISAAAGVALCNFEVELNGMRVREPEAMTGEYKVAMGDFGVPAYGATLLAELVHIPDNADGCQPFPDLKQQGRRKGLPLIVLARRGNCYFVEKAWNAQEAGASAVLVMDDRDEGLLTMSNPEDRPEIAKLKNDVNIPCALVQKGVGDKLEAFLNSPDAASLVVELDWTDAVAHPDDRVEWEFWTSSNDGCGRACDRQGAFKRDFQAAAMQFEQHGYTAFAPHFMHRQCPANAMATQECAVNCIHKGRYCAYDSILGDFAGQFQPRQVVMEDKRQLCVFQQASQRREPWLWWRFAAAYSEACTMVNGRFGQPDCAEAVLLTLGLDGAAVNACMGDSDADEEHPLLMADMQAQGSQGDGNNPPRVLLLPTVIINTNQYRGRLDGASITRALCAGFAEATEPEICLSGSLQYDDCQAGNGGCWAQGNASACVDTFRGRVCQCPRGYTGDGMQCTDVDECAEGTAACDQTCTNTQGGYECSCKPGFRLFGGHSTVGLCLPKDMCGPAEDARCEMGCTTHQGQAQCTCNLPGLEVDQQNATSCKDLDECAVDNGGCQQTCTNFDPRITGQRFACSCARGSMVDVNNRFKCVDQKQILQRLGVQNALEAAGLPAGTTWITVIGTVAAAAAITLATGATIWHFRMRSHTQQQIRDIMKLYMPLDGDGPEHDVQQKQHLAGLLASGEPGAGGGSSTGV